MKTTYLSCADTAKLLRANLKTAFPRVKFGVRSKVYAGGASINVDWTDGPCEAAVARITGQFAGGRFDASIDLAFSVSHWLSPDGTATVASSQGSAGSGGYFGPEREWMPEPEAKLVHFGANYIFTSRKISPALMGRVVARLERKGYPVEVLQVQISAYDGSGHARQVVFSDEATRGFDMEREVYQAARRTHCVA